MGAAVFMILFWLGFRRFEFREELRYDVSKKEWERMYRRDRQAAFQLGLLTGQTRRILSIAILFFFVLFVPFAVNAQTTDDTVCISRAAAVKALEDSDARKALEAEAKVKDQAIADLKAEIANMRLEYVKAAAETTALKQQAVRDAAIIELLLKYARPKKVGLINLF